MNTTALKRIKRITSHAGHARFLAGLTFGIGHIPRQKDIPSPYSYGPTDLVHGLGGKAVIVRETAHKQYDVFEVPHAMIEASEDAIINRMASAAKI